MVLSHCEEEEGKQLCRGVGRGSSKSWCVLQRQKPTSQLRRFLGKQKEKKSFLGIFRECAQFMPGSRTA